MSRHSDLIAEVALYIESDESRAEVHLPDVSADLCNDLRASYSELTEENERLRANAEGTCPHCFRPLSAKAGVGQYECPWCIKEYATGHQQQLDILRELCDRTREGHGMDLGVYLRRVIAAEPVREE